ncbi:MAG: NADP-dependent malic enzyme [Verrucomicrobiota bacterium]
MTPPPDDFGRRSLLLHEQVRGKICLHNNLPVRTQDDLSLAYTPGVAEPCREIAEHPERVRDLTIKHNSIAIVTDGSAVLGLGNIGPEAALPVMEGKAMLFRALANLNAWPLCLATQDVDEIVETVRRIEPVFGGVNLEDISAPRCFEVEARLQDLGIPVFHDDQHGTAIVLVAALLNAATVTGRDLTKTRVVINGAGAAGTAIARLLRCVGHDPGVCVSVQDVVICDSRGAIHQGRDDLSSAKQELLAYTNRDDCQGSLAEVIQGADVFIGVSAGNLLAADHVRTMAEQPILFAMANPEPEILPDEAKVGGAAVVGTGRSDFPNQVNNVLAFPGVFRGALDAKAERITERMKMAAVHALAAAVEAPTAERILPSPLDPAVAPQVARAVAQAWG